MRLPGPAPRCLVVHGVSIGVVRAWATLWDDTGSMRAVGISVIGGTVEPFDLPEPPKPGPRDIVVDVRGAGIANWDDLVRTGAWDVGIRPPMALGVEAAGFVRMIGSGVTRFAAGDAVLVHSAPLRYQGAWAERFLAAEADVAAKPPSLDWMTAAVLPVPLLTASQVVVHLTKEPGTDVLIHGAGGLTGGMLVLMAVQAGYRVVATCSPASADRVRGYGAAETVDHNDPAWRVALHEAFPRGFGAVIVAVRGGSASVLPLVADGGQLLTITGDSPANERGIAMTNAYVAPDGPALETAAHLVARLGVPIPIAATVGFAETADALRRTTSGSSGGARVLDLRPADR
jgi:NADPH:quinone reductase-like Zn-dependent oxidoreductase